MKKIYVNYVVNVLLTVSFFICFITGLIKWPGLRQIIGMDLFRIIYFKNVSILHDWSGLIMGLLVLVHLILNWKWMVVVTKNIIFKRNKKTK